MIIPGLSYGGAETAFLRLACYLAQHANVSIATMSDDDVTREAHLKSKCSNLILIPLTEGKKLNGVFLKKTRKWYGMYRKLKELKSKSDAAISFLSGANLLNAVTITSSKVIVSIRGSRTSDRDLIGFQKFLWTNVFDFITLLLSDKVVCASHSIQNEFGKRFRLFKSRLLSIEGLVDQELLSKMQSATVEPEMERFKRFDTVISFGRLHIQKGYDFLISLFPDVLMRNPRSRLLIIGDGSQFEALYSLADSLEMAPGVDLNPDRHKIILCGYRDFPIRYLRYCCLFAFPSRGEGLPNALVEALYTGIPVLASGVEYGNLIDSSHPSTIVRPVRNLWPESHLFMLPPPDNLDSKNYWIDALTRRTLEPITRLSAKACFDATKKFDISSNGKKWLSLLP